MSKTIKPLDSPGRSSKNKLYRTPRTPPPMELREMEKSFILDNIAVGSLSDDYSKANPKHANPIPPYNAFNDEATQKYFESYGVKNTMDKTYTKKKFIGWKEVKNEDGYSQQQPIYKYQKGVFCSINGNLIDKYHQRYFRVINDVEYEFNSPKRYLYYRNKSGAGHSDEQINGHQPFKERIVPIIGYNGPFGYRRNNYKFIKCPSPFGLVTRLPIHSDPEAETERRQKAEEFRKRKEKMVGKSSSPAQSSRKSSSRSQKE